MLENLKEEILSRLYVLRAGLSVISVEKEKIDNLNFDIQIDEKQGQREVEKIRNQIKGRRSEISLERKKINKINPCNNIMREMKRKNRQSLLGKMALLIIAIFCGFWPFWFSKNIKPPEFLLWEWLLQILMLVSCGIAILLIMFIIGSCLEKGIFPHKKEEFKKLEEESVYIQQGKEDAPQKINNLLREIEVLAQEIPKEEEKSQKLITQKREIIKGKLRENFVLYNILEESYRGFLDVRDWQHIDLLIFYFESGRADDLKEALLLVDKQVQNDAIVNAINDASSRICGTINAGLQQLQSSMVKCFSLLSEQMHSMQQQMERQHSEQMAIQRAQLAGVLELAKEVNMSNALMQKANVNSMELMRDVEYMKTLAANEDMRRRNNL